MGITAMFCSQIDCKTITCTGTNQHPERGGGCDDITNILQNIKEEQHNPTENQNINGKNQTQDPCERSCRCGAGGT